MYDTNKCAYKNDVMRWSAYMVCVCVCVYAMYKVIYSYFVSGVYV